MHVGLQESRCLKRPKCDIGVKISLDSGPGKTVEPKKKGRGNLPGPNPKIAVRRPQKVVVATLEQTVVPASHT